MVDATPRAQSTVAPVARFGVVGALCALLNVAIVWVGSEVLGWPYLLAAACTCLITVPISYFAHRRFSFRSASSAGWAEFGRFVVQQLTQFALGLVLLALLVDGLGLRPAAAMAAVAAMTFAYGYVTNAFLVFHARGRW